MSYTLDYREIIREKIRQNRKVRGYRSQLAKAASCHSSYLSHVLKGQAQLTPDQAAALSDFWQMDKRDAEYFITLVNLERSSNPSLQRRLQERLQELRQSIELPQFEVSEIKMSYTHALQYFSHWSMSAVHRALDIPQLRTAQAISSHLSLPIENVEKILQFLVDMNFIHKVGKEWMSRDIGFVVNRFPELMRIYHSSLRSRANDSLEYPGTRDVHYTAVLTISRQDCLDILNSIHSIIARTNEAASKSKPEDLVAVTFDFFSL